MRARVMRWDELDEARELMVREARPPLPAVAPTPAEPMTRGLDAASLLALQRSAGNASVSAMLGRRAVGRPSASPLVIARMPIPTAVRLPGPVLLRQDDEEEEGWGEWAARQAKNPWVWVGVGLTALVGGLVYANREAIGNAIMGEAIKHPQLLATGAKVLGPEQVAKYAGDALVKGLENAANTPIDALSPTEHLADAGKALIKILPGGGLLTGAGELAKKASDNQEILTTAYEVAKELGPGYVFEVAKHVAKERGGEILVHGINAGSRSLIESAAVAYNTPGSPYW